MTELPALSLLNDLGVSPSSVLMIWLLWQNLKSTRLMVDNLSKQVGKLDKRVSLVEWKQEAKA